MGRHPLVKLLCAVLLVMRLFVSNIVELLNFIGLIKNFQSFFIIAFCFTMVALLLEKDVSKIKVAVRKVMVQLNSVLIGNDSVIAQTKLAVGDAHEERNRCHMVPEALIYLLTV